MRLGRPVLVRLHVRSPGTGPSRPGTRSRAGWFEESRDGDAKRLGDALQGTQGDVRPGLEAAEPPNGHVQPNRAFLLRPASSHADLGDATANVFGQAHGIGPWPALTPSKKGTNMYLFQPSGQKLNGTERRLFVDPPGDSNDHRGP